MKAACSGCSAPAWLRPSMVVISWPSCITASVRQALMRLPSTSTVQAPHWPRSQPFFEPVSPTTSRSASSSVTRGSSASRWSMPLMRRTTGIVAAGAGAAFGAAAAWATPSGVARPPRVATVACMKPRRESAGAAGAVPASSRSGLLSDESLSMVLACLQTAIGHGAASHRDARMQIWYHTADKTAFACGAPCWLDEYRYCSCNFYTSAMSSCPVVLRRSGKAADVRVTFAADLFL